MRKLLVLLAVLLSTTLFACGGGGGGDDSSSSSSKRVVAKVQASVVEGATVCVENTDICEQTDDNGTAILKVSSLPVNLTVKVADVVLGNVEANNAYVPITPLDIAEGDNQTAEKIGAFIHALAGDTTGSKQKIDLTNVELKGKIDKPLVEFLKDNITDSVSIEVKTDNETNETHTIKISNSGITFEGKKVDYDIKKIQTLKEREKRLSELVEFFMKYDGKTVAFHDSEKQNSTCVLHVNPLNPLQFKFTDCENPENNDSSWETASTDKDRVKVVDENGVVSYILDVDLEDGKVEYRYKDNGDWIEGYFEVSEGQQSEEEEEILSKLVEFFKKYDGKTVAFHDSEKQNSTCVLHVNPLNPLQFKFTDCENSENNDSTWEETFADKDGVKVVDEDGVVSYIFDVDLEDGKVEYKYKDNEDWIEGYFEVSEGQQSEEEELSNDSDEAEESGENGAIIEAFKPFFPSLDEVRNFLRQNNGKTVKTSDGGKCELTYNNDDEQDEFVLSSCSGTNFLEGTYKLSSGYGSYPENPNRVFVLAPDNKDEDVFFFEDDTTLCTSDGCIYVGDEPDNVWKALGDWREFDVAKNSPDLVAESCVYFGKDGLYYPEGDTNTKLADYNVNVSENLITFTNAISDFDVLSMKVFRISNVEGKTYIITYEKCKNGDENIGVYEKVNYCDNEDE